MDYAALQARYAALGLRPEQFAACLGEEGLSRPWRVAVVERDLLTLIGLDSKGEARTLHARPAGEPAVVGDWVWLSQESEGDACVREVLERRTHLRRGAVHASGAQWIAANLDTVFVVAAFAATAKLERRSLQARRIERFVSAVAEGGALPVVLLNKADLDAHEGRDHQTLSQELQRRLGVDVIPLSARTGEGMRELQTYLQVGETVAFIGPSGVGKSTLINTLLGSERQSTGHVREGDQKGRHTTTRRELLQMPAGALLVDTPGMRELSVFLEDARVPGFDEVDALAAQCRYADCRHASEPGCAVREAVRTGSLDSDRLRSYLSIAEDAERGARRTDPLARHEERRAGRRFGRLVKQAKKLKGRS